MGVVMFMGTSKICSTSGTESGKMCVSGRCGAGSRQGVMSCRGSRGKVELVVVVQLSVAVKMIRCPV